MCMFVRPSAEIVCASARNAVEIAFSSGIAQPSAEIVRVEGVVNSFIGGSNAWSQLCVEEILSVRIVISGEATHGRSSAWTAAP